MKTSFYMACSCSKQTLMSSRWCTYLSIWLPNCIQMSSSSTHLFAFINYWNIRTLAVSCSLEDWWLHKNILSRMLFYQISVWLTRLPPVGLGSGIYFLSEDFPCHLGLSHNVFKLSLPIYLAYIILSSSSYHHLIYYIVCLCICFLSTAM